MGLGAMQDGDNQIPIDRDAELRQQMRDSLLRADKHVSDAALVLGFAKPSVDLNHAMAIIADAEATLRSARAAVAAHLSDAQLLHQRSLLRPVKGQEKLYQAGTEL